MVKSGGKRSHLLSHPLWLGIVFDPEVGGDMLKKAVKDWFVGLVDDFYSAGMQKLLT
jgi:hypothetical protein